MSNGRAQRRRLERRRRRPYGRTGHSGSHFEPDADYCVMVGWAADEQHIEAVKAETHDKMIAMLGDRRRSGIGWKWAEGEDADRIMDTCEAGEKSTELLAHYAHIRKLLADHGGFVVLTMAQAVPPGA